MTRLLAYGAGVAALLAIFFGMLVLPFDVGRKVEREGWVTQQNAALKKAGTDYDDRLRQANRSAAAAIDDARQARDFAASIQLEIAHVRVPLVTPVRSPRCPADPDPRRADVAHALVAQPAALAASSADAEPLAAAPDEPPGLDAGSGVWLTVSAVRLWNSALAGEQLPAGACRADDAASAACAARSAASIDDAFVNHTRNAASCREDRSQLNRLIDVLEQRAPRAPPEPKP